MTRKETEKRLRANMQQSIPDRDALWSKIESALPEVQQQTEPERPQIRHTRTARHLAMAACFVLVIGGAGLFAAMHLNGKQDMTMHETAPMYFADEENACDMADEAPKAENAESAAEQGYAEDAAADDAADEDAAYEDAGEAQTPAAEIQNGVTSGSITAPASANENDVNGANDADVRDADGASAEPAAPAVGYQAMNYGETFLLEDASGLADLVESFLTAEYVVHEDAPDIAQAGNQGLCVAIRYSEERVVYLTMQDGENRMVEMRGIHARVYRMPEEIEDYLNAQMTD